MKLSHCNSEVPVDVKHFIFLYIFITLIDLKSMIVSSNIHVVKVWY